MADHDLKGKPLPSRDVAASVLRMMAPRAALKAKPVARGISSIVSGLAIPDDPANPKKRARDEERLPNGNQLAILAAGSSGKDVAEASALRDFTITLDMGGKNSLGIDVDWVDGKTLLVKSVQMGPVADWNMEKGPDKALRPGDRIIAVNGISGESIGAVAMVQECKGKPYVQLTCRTQRPRPQQRMVSTPYSTTFTEVTTGNATTIQAIQDGSASSTARKRAKNTGEKSLYSFLPAPDPEMDETAAAEAKKRDPFAEPSAKETRKLCIFLDIDGVLRRLEGTHAINVNGEVLPLHLLSRKFEAEAVRALKWLVHKTGAGIVLSSEWRRDNALREEVGATLRMAGLPPMRGITPVLEPREEVAIGPPNTEEREKGPATMRLRWAERRAREISAWLRDRPGVERWLSLDDLDLSMADKFRLPETLWMGPGLVLTDAEAGFTMGDARKASEMLLDTK